MTASATRGPHPGLCASCTHHRVTGNRRGSVFHLCGKSLEDSRFPKYPPLPVLRCGGYERATGATSPDESADEG